ncbi:MAG: hypothetical protein ACRD40_10355 [Candidatus Acidiferrales bacterium]
MKTENQKQGETADQEIGVPGKSKTPVRRPALPEKARRHGGATKPTKLRRRGDDCSVK